MEDRRGRELLRHKRVLIAVRFVFLVLVGSLALSDLGRESLPVALPIILLAYLLTNAAMAFERSQTFFSQRVQACLLLFDLFVLVVAMASLEKYREDLFLAMFLVMLLASAGQKVSVSVGGCLAVAALYLGFSMKDGRSFQDSLANVGTGLPVLLVVAIYVGYVSESVARERRRREEAEERLQRELHGMNRFQALASGGLTLADPASLLGSIAETARDLLDAAGTAVFWRARGEIAFRTAASCGFPEALAARWTADSASPLSSATGSKEAVRLPETPLAPGPVLLIPFADRADDGRGILAVLWSADHERVRGEEEAGEALVRHAALGLENASLYRLLAQARDVWQAAFLSIPAPVVLLDGDGRVVQANPAFLALGEFDLATLVGTRFADVLEGGATADGRPADLAAPAAGAVSVRLSLPRLGGEFDVAQGPYLGADQGNRTGSVWVFRKLAPEVLGPPSA
ncbi:MAG TPA: PAS domain-containing protein [Planctomycetota bacterium]|nr:PAS domain-containing protein [Planctomycetota bacterium]